MCTQERPSSLKYWWGTVHIKVNGSCVRLHIMQVPLQQLFIFKDVQNVQQILLIQ